MDVICCKCRNVIRVVDCQQQVASHGLCEACRLELEHEEKKSASVLQTIATLLRVQFQSPTS